MVAAIALAFVFGYSLTLYAVLKAGLTVKAAVKVALTADTISIVVMEAVDNSVVVLIPGALDAHLTELLFWGSLALSFVVTLVARRGVVRRQETGVSTNTGI